MSEPDRQSNGFEFPLTRRDLKSFRDDLVTLQETVIAKLKEQDDKIDAQTRVLSTIASDVLAIRAAVGIGVAHDGRRVVRVKYELPSLQKLAFMAFVVVAAGVIVGVVGH